MKKIFGIFLCLLVSTWVFAEDESRDNVYQISSFAGGLNEKTSSFSLKKDQGDICQNVRFNTELGSLTKRNNLNLYGTADATNPILGMHRFYKKDGTKVLLVNADNKIYKGTDSSGAFTSILTVSTGSRRWQWTTWHDIAIGCDGYNQPVKYDGTSTSATYLGTCLATDAGSGTGMTGTSYSYKVSFYTASYEVLFNVASNAVTMTGNDMSLSMIPIAPDTYGGEDVVGRKIYRTKTGGSTYYLLSNGTIADNSTVVLTDSDADGDLTATTYPAGDATYKPPTGRFLLIHDGRLWFANDPSSNPSRAWYSDTEAHDVFIDDDYWDIRQDDGDAVTFIKQILGVLTIGKNNSISKLYTDGVDTDWTLSDPFTFIGCQAPYTASNYARGIIYLSRDGLYSFNGQYPQLISDVVTPVINDINSSDFENCWGIYHRNLYYLAYSSESSSVAYNNRVLIYDIIGDAYSIDLLNVNCYSAFNSGSDWGILYMGGSDYGSVKSDTLPDNTIRHRRHSDFTGLWDDMRYIPVAVGGDSENPIIEISRTETIDELVGTIDNQKGIIDRIDPQGNYVSQPLRMDAGTYDKLYWNESIPISGGDVTIKLRTSDTGEKNLLLNDCFEFWDNCIYDQATTPTTIVQPNDWVAASTSTSVVACASDSTVYYRGDYSVKVATESTISQVLLNSSDYANKSITFNAWIKCADSTNVENAYIEIAEGGTGNIIGTSRAYYGLEDQDWRETTTTLALSSTATTVTLKCAVMGNGITAPAYFDQVMVVEGTSATNDWTEWSSAFTNSSGDDISGETVGEYMQYLVEMSADDINYSPTLIMRDNYLVQITYEQEGETQSNDIPMEWRSGWLDFGKPIYTKSLRWLTAYVEGTDGILFIKVENLEGDSDTFDIDLAEYPERYSDGFSDGSLVGTEFRVTITNNDDNPVKVKRLELRYNVNPLDI